jgi:hypothetical protein
MPYQVVLKCSGEKVNKETFSEVGTNPRRFEQPVFMFLYSGTWAHRFEICSVPVWDQTKWTGEVGVPIRPAYQTRRGFVPRRG